MAALGEPVAFASGNDRGSVVPDKEQSSLFRPRRLVSTVDLQSIDGIGPRIAARIRARWPKGLQDSELADNPYLLTELPQIGFRLADKVALAMGIAKGAKVRQAAAGEFILKEAEQQGNTCLPVGDFAARFSELLGVPLGSCELDERTVMQDEAGNLGLARTFRAENRAAEIVKGMCARHWTGFTPLLAADGMLAEDQWAALQMIQAAPIFCLLGSPGTGKTTLIRSVLASNPSLKIALCAPTGKAAKRIEELTGRPAQTIHRLLEPEWVSAKPGSGKSSYFRFRRNASNPLPHDMVICDETSMVDIRLFADLLMALRPDSRLLLVGDIHQLPSVGPGRVLSDLRAAVPNCELTTLKRQDPTLLIARNCARIRDGEPVLVDNAAAQDFFFIPADTPQAIANAVVDLVTKRLPAKYGLDPNREIMTLTALRDRGPLSAKGLNERLRKELNDYENGLEFAINDRVLQRHNNYDLQIFNGEIGTVVDVSHGRDIRVLFENPDREVEIDWDEKDLMHSWALTTHKAQGSEWPWVVIPVHRSNGVLVPNRAHFYTSISRGKQGIVVVGDRAEMDAIIGRVKEQQRYTRLAELLK